MSSPKVPFYVFMMLVVMSPLAIDIFLPAIPLISQSLNASLASVQATVTVFLAAMGLGQIVAGPLADKFGRRPLALGGMAIYLVGGFTASFAPTVEVLLLSRVLQGLGACALSVSAMSGIRDSYGPDRSARMYSYVNGVICVIPALAPLLGGFLTEIGGWRYNFYFITCTAALVGIFILLKLPETRPSNTKSDGKLISRARYRGILAHPAFRYHSGLVMLAMAVIIGYVTISPAVLMVNMKQTPLVFSYWFGANAVINIIAAFLAPKVTDFIGKRAALYVAVLTCVLSAIGLIMFTHINDPFAFMGPVFMGNIGFCFIFAICGGSALKPFGKEAGTASALMGLFQMSGASFIVGVLQLLPISGVQVLGILMCLPMLWVLVSSVRKSHSVILETLS